MSSASAIKKQQDIQREVDANDEKAGMDSRISRPGSMPTSFIAG